MVVAALSTRGFRNLDDERIELGSGLTTVAGLNGAGKTNLLEALFFGLTGRSCRTRRERELIAFGSSLARTEVEIIPEPGELIDAHTIRASVSPEEGRRRRVEGRDVGAEDERRRPAVSVFMPDRLALVKGPPAPRRAHLDRLAAALWPGRAETRAAYGRALAQRNALLSRVRRGADPAGLDAWDRELAERAAPLVAARRAAESELAGAFTETAERLGLGTDVSLSYRPRTGEAGVEEIATELATRRAADIERGFSGWGPHRDDVELSRDSRSLRRYGSQGQQRLALLALLFAEREALRRARQALPLMLLDDVMSELDPGRRLSLVEMLAEGGQAMITTTEFEHVPPAQPTRRLAVADGAIAVAEADSETMGP